MNIQHHRIREYAYHIWQSEGMPEGQQQRHWEMACKLVDGNSTTTDEDTTQAEQNIVTFEDNLNQSLQTQSATVEPLAQVNPNQPLCPTEPVKSLIDTGPITEPVITQVKNIGKTTKPKKPKTNEKTNEKLGEKISENEAI
jgi:hypothetical protein